MPAPLFLYLVPYLHQFSAVEYKSVGIQNIFEKIKHNFPFELFKSAIYCSKYPKIEKA